MSYNNPSSTLASRFSNSNTATSSTVKATYTVRVGPKEDPHGYVPRSLNASVGDLIVFEFYPRNHSVVQADWKAPCMPADGNYFFSGIKNDFNEVNGQVVGRLPTWNWTVDREEPTFFYCTGADSCIRNGMVGVINPNITQTWESQRKAALEAPYMLLPGQSMPAEGSNPNTETTATHLSPSPSAGTSSTSSPNALSGGAIAGIVVGSVAFLAILCSLLFLLGWNRVYKQWLSQGQEGSGDCASSSKNTRTVQWVDSSTPAAIGVGVDSERSEGDRGSTGFPGSLRAHGSSLLHEPAADGTMVGLEFGPGSRPGTAPGTGTGTGFVSVDHCLPLAPAQTGTSSIFDGGYGISSPLGAQVPFPQQQQQQPHWNWDHSIHPFHLSGCRGEPSELEADNHK
ncbi:hypothetical protein AN4815.2 [Aspergillus nidulans FGSC A4]|uniref:Extracellular serine-rich protein (AFU_orthologue AFUA_6G00670) n=1 Tax=Emericella nidulans (strain FGSC A4 / ATCC 38163 / CBS 112.46 / NRRL 194 / M139) TaxID=227321 RepID=Q5B3R5_EMENI|nr:hypothetical protein [Aspergillus nidulans FGSC A4]EAA60385.1 hypothetical protein AN4815.2 [Aspergillus nidulans FGSC A4]CBF76721.1 TPA: extracellular serine-rich protein (AFU_orthologue; AFUA_6G00670) [Aspergillus nidulans FGSC A4]|eukprot:XP_662419.1 hypothetical protein AN4815.2 [Aspergillus nidulans FGSC A4]